MFIKYKSLLSGVVRRCIGFIGRRWPFWRGRSRLLSIMRASLDGTVASTYLLNSKTAFCFPTHELCGLTLHTFGENDSDLFAALDSVTHVACQTTRQPCVVDIGANLGAFALRLLERHSIRMIAYEPQSELAALLLSNSARAGVTQSLTVRGVALSRVRGTMGLALNPENSGNASLIETAQELITVSTLADDFTPEEWRDVALVKIDVEGHEAQVIEGGVSLFREHRPVLILEVNSTELTRGGSSPADIHRLLKTLGYTDIFAVDSVLYPAEHGLYPVANIIAWDDSHALLTAQLPRSTSFVPRSRHCYPVLSTDWGRA